MITLPQLKAHRNTHTKRHTPTTWREMKTIYFKHRNVFFHFFHECASYFSDSKMSSNIFQIAFSIRFAMLVIWHAVFVVVVAAALTSHGFNVLLIFCFYFTFRCNIEQDAILAIVFHLSEGISFRYGFEWILGNGMCRFRCRFTAMWLALNCSCFALTFDCTRTNFSYTHQPGASLPGEKSKFNWLILLEKLSGKNPVL